MQMEIELTEEESQELAKVGEKLSLSRDDVIRLAISQYLERELTLGQAFGLWADRNEDGLAYQERLRAEWDDR